MLILLISLGICITFVSAKLTHYDYYQSYASLNKNEKQHILDFGEVLTAYDIGTLTVSFSPKDGCKTSAFIYISKDGKSWKYLGKIDLTAVSVTKDFTDLEDDFRYIKIISDLSKKCYIDFSAAWATLKDPPIPVFIMGGGSTGGGGQEEQVIPEFNALTAGLAVAITTIGFMLLRKRR